MNGLIATLSFLIFLFHLEEQCDRLGIDTCCQSERNLTKRISTDE